MSEEELKSCWDEFKAGYKDINDLNMSYDDFKELVEKNDNSY